MDVAGLLNSISIILAAAYGVGRYLKVKENLQHKIPNATFGRRTIAPYFAINIVFAAVATVLFIARTIRSM